MHYLIYRTTNLVNGKYYVGKHKTKYRDDCYLGSGKLLHAAFKKYGRENFVREILLECSSEEEMNLAERILVVPDREVNYNLCPGGQGGWGYLNTNGFNNNNHDSIETKIKLSNAAKSYWTDETRRDLSIRNINNHKKGIMNTSFGGRSGVNSTSKEAIQKRKETYERIGHSRGSRNSQFGTCWMTNGAKNIKIKRDEIDKWIEMGYRQGRYCGEVVR